MTLKTLLVIALLATGAWAQDGPCLADALLDVSDSPGAGPAYPKPSVEASCEGDQLVVRSNGIPHYEFVQVTPNPLLERDNEFRVPARPQLADQKTPIPLLGSLGFAVNGMAIFGPNEGGVPVEEQFGDPIFNSIMDACMGHTAQEYHYHALVQKCLSTGVRPGEPSPILGFGFDGIPIRGPWGCVDADCSRVVRFRSSWEQVREPHQDAWDAYDYVENEGPEYLDLCNGHTGPEGDYHYHATETWPYILGCYSGTPMPQARPGAPRPNLTQGHRPPAAARPPAARRPRGGGPGRTPRPSQSEVTAAAEALGLASDDVAKALRAEPGNLKPVNLAASARALGVEQGSLTEALGRQQRPRRQRPNLAPPGEPECFFRCGQSEEDAVGCTLTPDHKVLCFRPCDDNKCG